MTLDVTNIDLSKSNFNYQTNRDKAVTLLRKKQVLERRAAGVTFFDIARELGCTEMYVHKLYKKSLKTILVENVDQLRKLESERLDFLQNKVMKILENPNPLVSAGNIVHKQVLHDGKPVLDEEGNPIFEVVIDQSKIIDAVNAVLRVMDRRARLLGLDAPIKANIDMQAKLKIEAPPAAPLSKEELLAEAILRGLPASIFNITPDQPEIIDVTPKNEA